MGQSKQILVGVDGSPESRTALEWAADEAVQHGSELVLLMAWQATQSPPPAPSATFSVQGATTTREATREAAEGLLMESTRGYTRTGGSSCIPGSRRATLRGC